MTGYEIRILFKTEVDAVQLIQAYESQLNLGNKNLESVLPEIFVMKNTYQSENFHIELFERNTNEILINCIGTKYPTLELQNLFTELEIVNEHGIKLQSIFDGDGNDEYFYIVNGLTSSRQKYSAFYRKFKILDSKAKKKKTKENTKKLLTPPKKRIPKDNSPSEKQLSLINKFDYGRSGKMNTALIRVLIRSKPKRELVRELFLKHVTLSQGDDLNEFSNSFVNLVDSDTLAIHWCGFTKIKSETVFEAPAEIIFGLSFVIEQDNYLYLGFDLENLGFTLSQETVKPYEYLGLTSRRDADKAFERLILVFDAIDGVNRTWIKCRLGELPLERYVFYPDAGRNPEVFHKDLSEDYEWPSGW